MTNYNKQAEQFLTATSTTFAAKFKTNGKYFADDEETRDIYIITLKNDRHRYRFTFGQSINNSGTHTAPTAYDVLSCLTKYPVGTFEDFCYDYGYNTDSRKAYKTYKAVLREWKNVQLLFNSKELELLQEIN